MPRALATVVALAAALLTATVRADDIPAYVDPDARHPGLVGPCQYSETLNLGGTIYLADPGAHQPRFLRDAVVGEAYATVAARDNDADACAGELRDGHSTYLEAGATLHAVDDWSPSFRLVFVQPSGRLVLYQAGWSTTAERAGDYLDLADRGASVAYGPRSYCIPGGCVDYFELPPTSDDQARTFIDGLLASPIDPTAMDLSFKEDARQISVQIVFPDGTGLSMVFDCDTRTSTTGVVLSDDAVGDPELGRLCPTDDPLSSWPAPPGPGLKAEDLGLR